MRRHGAPERRSAGHVASATTTTAGVRRRPGAEGPAPAPHPGFPAAGGRGLGARSLAGSLAWGARGVCAHGWVPQDAQLSLGSADPAAPVIVAEGRAGSASWGPFLPLASPGQSVACNLGDLQVQRKRWQKGAAC